MEKMILINDLKLSLTLDLNISHMCKKGEETKESDEMQRKKLHRALKIHTVSHQCVLLTIPIGHYLIFFRSFSRFKVTKQLLSECYITWKVIFINVNYISQRFRSLIL